MGKRRISTPSREWNPSLHPRDSNGRFTKSAARYMRPQDTARVRAALSGLRPRSFDTGQERRGYLAALGASGGPAVASFRAGGWRNTNTALRTGRGTPAEAAGIDAEMRPLPDDLIVDREVPAAMFGNVDMRGLSGARLTDAAYTATRLGDQPAAQAGMVRMRIAVPRGTHAVVDPDTGEVLLARGTDLAVTSVTPNDAGGWDMHLAVIPAGDSSDAGGGDQGDAAAPAASTPAAADSPFDALDQARIRNAVAEHAAGYHGGPLQLSQDDAARYVSEGHLGPLVSRHGLNAVWEAVAAEIARNPDSLVDNRKARSAEIRAKSEATAVRALEHFKAGELDEALAALAEGEAADPDFRSAGRGHTWSSMRDAIQRKAAQREAAPAAAPAPAAPTPAAAPAAPGPPRMSTRERIRNTWGATQPGDQVSYHPDGEIGRTVDGIGGEDQLEIEGDSLANVLGRAATDVTVGRLTPQQGVDRYRQIRDQLPEGSLARRRLDMAIENMDAPDTGAPTVPAGTLAPLRELTEALHRIPLMRRHPDREVARLAGVLDDFANGRTGGLQLINAIRGIHNIRHESESDAGKGQIDQAVNRAVRALEEMRRNDRTSINPPRPGAAPNPAPATTTAEPDAIAAAVNSGMNERLRRDQLVDDLRAAETSTTDPVARARATRMRTQYQRGMLTDGDVEAFLADEGHQDAPEVLDAPAASVVAQAATQAVAARQAAARLAGQEQQIGLFDRAQARGDVADGQGSFVDLAGDWNTANDSSGTSASAGASTPAAAPEQPRRPASPRADRAPTGTFAGEIPAGRAERLDYNGEFGRHVRALTYGVGPGEEPEGFDVPDQAEAPQVGDEVMVQAFGMLRRGIVTRSGTHNARVAYATPSGSIINESERPHSHLWHISDPQARPRENRALLLPTPTAEARPERRGRTDEEKKTAAAAQREKQKADDTEWADRKVQDIRERVARRRAQGDDVDPREAVSGVSDRGLLLLAAAAGVRIPTRTADRGNLRADILAAIERGDQADAGGSGGGTSAPAGASTPAAPRGAAGPSRFVNPRTGQTMTNVGQVAAVRGDAVYIREGESGMESAAKLRQGHRATIAGGTTRNGSPVNTTGTVTGAPRLAPSDGANSRERIVVPFQDEEGRTTDVYVSDTTQVHVGGGSSPAAAPAARPAPAAGAPKRGRQVPAAAPARLAMRVRNPEAPILQQIDEFHLTWRSGRPAGWSQADVDEHSRVLDDYMAEHGDASPHRLRGPDASPEVRRLLDDVMGTSPLTEDVEVWRGLSEPRHLLGDHLDQADMTGATVTDPSFASTSTSRAVAGEYAGQAVSRGGSDGGNVVVQMHVPAGVGAVHLGGDHQEVLLDRDLRWTVTSDSGPGRSPRKISVRVERSSGRPTPATSAPAGTSAPTVKAGKVAPSEVWRRMDQAATLDEVRAHVAELTTIGDMLAAAKAGGIVTSSSWTKARLREALFNAAARRLDGAAIERMVRGPKA